jgi:uncharacterized phage protein gp47/JayE
MAFTIPTLRELAERARRAMRGNLPGLDAWLEPNNAGPTAKVIAGQTHELFGFADYIFKQRFALTADGENLDLHGEELGIARRPAAPALGAATFTATEALTVDAGAILTRSDGREYRVVTGGSLPGAGTVSLAIRAVEDGVAGAALAGTPLTSLSGVDGDHTVEVATGGLTDAADVEDDESYRARILFRKRNPPHGGAPADYVMWAQQVPGVTRVFVERVWAGAGTVRVFPLMDDRYADGIPAPGDIAVIKAHLETLAPAGATLTVAAPTAVPVDVEIDNLLPTTNAVQEAIRAELRAGFRRLSRVAGSDPGHASLPFLASAASFSRSWIWQAIANATGEERHVLTAPAADVSLTGGQIATLGAVTFI